MPARLAIALLLWVSLPVAAMAETAQAELWETLRKGGHVVLMRHAIAPGTGDAPGFRLGDCATQRNLDDVGRALARATGAAFRANGVTQVEVRTSEWCRAQETANLLGLGQPTPDPMLNSFFSERARADARTEALRRYVAGVAPGSPTRVLVTHQVNITALTGIHPRSGEAAVIAPGPDGGRVIGRLGPFGE